MDGDFTELTVSLILGKHRFKPFLTFCSEYRIGQGWVTQLHLTIPNLLNAECGIVQIDGIANRILPKYIVCSHSDLCQLFLRERVQVIHIRVQQFFFSQFFQRTVLSAVYNDTLYIPVNTEINQICVDLDRNFILGDGGMTHTHMPQIFVLHSGVEHADTVSVNVAQCLFQRCFGTAAVNHSVFQILQEMGALHDRGEHGGIANFAVENPLLRDTGDVDLLVTLVLLHNKEVALIDRKRFCFSGYICHIAENLLDERVTVKGIGVNHLPVYNTVSLQPFTDRSRVYIVKEIVFRFCLLVGIIYLLESRNGRVQVLHKVRGDSFPVLVPVQNDADRHTVAVTVQNLFYQFIPIQELPGIGDFAIVAQIVNSACHGHRGHIHGGQFFQIQLSQFLRQHGFQIGELLFLDNNPIHLGDDSGVFQVCIDRNAVQIIVRQSGANRDKVSVFLHAVLHTVLLPYKVTDEPLCFCNFVEEVGGSHNQIALVEIPFKFLPVHVGGFLVGKI